MADKTITLIMSRVEDELIRGMVFKSWTAFSTDWRAAMTLLITLWVVITGYQALTGGLNLGRVAKGGILAIIAWTLFTQWGLFSMFVFDIFVKIPNELAGTLTKAITGNSASSVYTGLDNLWDGCVEVTKRLASEGGLSGTGLGFLLLAGLNIAVTWLALGIAVGFLIFVDVMLAILLMIALIAIPFIIFDSTRGITMKWVQATVGFGFIKIMIMAALVFMLGIIGTSVDELAKTTTEFNLEAVLAHLLLIAASTIVFLLIFLVGAAIGNGVGMAAGIKMNNAVMRAITFNYGHWRK